MAKKGYWEVCYKSVSNPTALSEYMKLATGALEALGGRLIIGAKPAKTHEAGLDQSVVVVEFENLEKAIAGMKATSTGPRLTLSVTPCNGIFVSSKGAERLKAESSCTAF